MTNKESIQAAHENAIKESVAGYQMVHDTDPIMISGLGKAATSCTTITAEAIGEAMIFTERLCRTGFRYNRKTNQWVCKTIAYTHDELKEKFLNQTPNTK